MRSGGQGAMLLCVVMVAACSGGSDATSSREFPSAPNLSASAAPRSSGPQQVTGSATILLPVFDNALERYSVSAIRHTDGSVTGELKEIRFFVASLPQHDSSSLAAGYGLSSRSRGRTISVGARVSDCVTM